jgi:hypothetical protein
MSSTGDDSGGSTGAGPGSRCQGMPLINEEFVAVPVTDDTWLPYTEGAGNATIRAGALWVSAGSGSSGFVRDYWGLLSAEAVPPSGEIGLEIVAPPETDLNAEIFFGFLFPDENGIYVSVGLGVVAVEYWNGSTEEYTTDASAPFSFQEHRHMRVVYSDPSTTLDVQVSANGEDWTSLHPYDLSARGLDLSDASLDIAIGLWFGPFTGDVAAIDNVYVCASP